MTPVNYYISKKDVLKRYGLTSITFERAEKEHKYTKYWMGGKLFYDIRDIESKMFVGTRNNKHPQPESASLDITGNRKGKVEKKTRVTNPGLLDI